MPFARTYIWFGDNIKEYIVQGSTTNGYITPIGDTLSYKEGTTVQFEAIPDEGSEFSGWTGDTVSTVNPIKLQLTEDTIINLTANFTEMLKYYSITLTPSTNGTVSLSPEKDQYLEDDTVMVTAVANDGYQFVEWEQNFLPDTNVIYIIMVEDITITPVFDELTSIANPRSEQHFRLWSNPASDVLTIQLDQTTSKT